jgi:hypothetical protein
MNTGSLDTFRIAFSPPCAKQARIERETQEITQIIEEARNRNDTTVFIKEHYCLDVMRALRQFCTVKATYHYKKLIGYQLKW